MTISQNIILLKTLGIIAMLFSSIVPFAQVTIDTSGFITLKPGSALTIKTDLKIKSGKFNSGHLCDQNPNGEITINSNITIERYFSANHWHNSSCPVKNNNCSVYSGTDLIFYYDETIIQNDWDFGWVFYEGALDEMKGYDVYLPEPVTVNYTGTSSAELNTGHYTINVTRTNVPNGEIESRKGWNLIGNPYPSPVDWLNEIGWVKTPINDAKYIWDPANDNYTIFLGGEEPVGLNGGTQFIPSNQGFWVQALQNGTVEVNNSARVGLMQSTPGFYKTEDTKYPLLCLRTEVNGYYDETIIRFLKNASNDFDTGYDAYKFKGRSSQCPQISTFCNNDLLAINTLKEIKPDTYVDLAFEFLQAEICEIFLAPCTDIGDTTEVFVKDLYTGEMTNIMQTKSISFLHQPQNNIKRFRIYFNPTEDVKNSITSENAYFIYASGKTIFVKRKTSLELPGEIKIFDMFGRMVHSQHLPTQREFYFDLNAKAGFYAIEISNENFRTTTIVGMN